MLDYRGPLFYLLMCVGNWFFHAMNNVHFDLVL